MRKLGQSTCGIDIPKAPSTGTDPKDLSETFLQRGYTENPGSLPCKGPRRSTKELCFPFEGGCPGLRWSMTYRGLDVLKPLSPFLGGRRTIILGVCVYKELK